MKYLIFDTIVSKKFFVASLNLLDRLNEAKKFLVFLKTVKNIFS
jgi:hypothetical protein